VSITEPQPGQILANKYRLLGPLASGGMGSIWRAEHMQLQSAVAVKFMGEEVAASAEGRQRFLREARMAAALSSPHVVQIMDFGVDGQHPFIVMELLEGQSLHGLLEQRGRLDLDTTIHLLRQVARAVGKAHDEGIVHRDLKPANIFLIDNDGEFLVKLLDFGIAKAQQLGSFDSLAEGTRTGAFLGTPHYASPEQVEGSKRIDHRTDVWALGVIVYQCLTGERPFTGGTFGAVAVSICSRPLPSAEQLRRAPVGFDVWFAQACSRDMDQRFGSARQAVAALEGLGRAGASQGAPYAPPLAASSTGQPSASWGTNGRMSLSAEQTPVPGPKKKGWLWAAAATVLCAVGAGAWAFSTQGSSSSGASTVPSITSPAASAASASPPQEGTPLSRQRAALQPAAAGLPHKDGTEQNPAVHNPAVRILPTAESAPAASQASAAPSLAEPPNRAKPPKLQAESRKPSAKQAEPEARDNDPLVVKRARRPWKAKKTSQSRPRATRKRREVKPRRKQKKAEKTSQPSAIDLGF
jgi:serine/threonine-protein kinase